MAESISVKDEEFSLGELAQFSESVRANHKNHFRHTIDYFDVNYGILVDRDNPSSLEFSVSLLNEILCNIKPGNRIWGKIKHAAFLLNLATRNFEFEVLYQLYDKIETEVSSRNIAWNDDKVGVIFEDQLVNKLLVKEDVSQSIEIEHSKIDSDVAEDENDNPLDIVEDKDDVPLDIGEDKVDVPLDIVEDDMKCKDEDDVKQHDSVKPEDDMPKKKRGRPRKHPKPKYDEDQDWIMDGVDYETYQRKLEKQEKTKHYLKCSECKFRCPKQRDLDRHAFEKHKATRLCMMCGHLSNTFQEFQAHNESHIMTCDICSNKFLGKKQYDFHMKSAHKITSDADGVKEEGEDARVPCDICGVVIKAVSMPRHMEVLHSTSEEPHKCDVCGKELKSKYILKIHRETHFRTMVKCPECGKMVKSLKHHFRRNCGNQEKERIKCELCDKTFSLKQGLKRHKESVHLKITYHQCELCDFQSYGSHNLKIHMAGTHTKEQIWINCQVCDKRTTNMEYHMKTYHFEEFIKKTKDEEET